MKIGVVSDTHIDEIEFGIDFFNRLALGPFADVELILHAGDVVHPDLLHCLDTKPIIAVRGNCDKPDPGVPLKRIVEVNGQRIGLIHGWGGPESIVGHVMAEFSSERLDALVFGHSHFSLCRRVKELLLFNPGSALDRREAPFHSVGILTLDQSICGEIVNLEQEPALFSYTNGVFA